MPFDCSGFCAYIFIICNLIVFVAKLLLKLVLISGRVPSSHFEMACLDTHNSEASCSCDKLLSFLNFCNLLENVIIYISSPSCFLYSTITQTTKLLKKWAPPISQSINFDMSKCTVTNFSEKMKILNHLKLNFRNSQ